MVAIATAGAIVALFALLGLVSWIAAPGLAGTWSNARDLLRFADGVTLLIAPYVIVTTAARVLWPDATAPRGVRFLVALACVGLTQRVIDLSLLAFHQKFSVAADVIASPSVALDAPWTVASAVVFVLMYAALIAGAARRAPWGWWALAASGALAVVAAMVASSADSRAMWAVRLAVPTIIVAPYAWYVTRRGVHEWYRSPA